MAKILWGKPTITIGSTAVPTPVEGSTSLSTERGDKHEARIEGGGNEAVRFDRGKFTLEFEVRFATGRTMPLESACADGRISGGPYSITVESADETGAPKMTMNAGEGSYEDVLDMDGGARRHYYFESTVPQSGNQIDWSASASS